VSIENAQPYLDGLRVTFKIGNPQFATYDGFDMEISWSKGRKTEKFVATLRLGTWTSMQVTLAPTEAGHKTIVVGPANVIGSPEAEPSSRFANR
jgi:hypothetical protein